MTVDWIDDNPHPHMALAQYTQGVPIQRKPLAIGNGTQTILGASNLLLISGITFDQPSYQLLVSLSLPANAGAIPFGRLLFNWVDTASGFSLEPDEAVLAGGNNAADFTYISGPARADTLTLQVNNLDPAQTLTVNFGLSQNSHLFEQFRVQETTVQPVNGFTRPSLRPQMGVIASVGAVVPGNSQIDRLATAWFGEAVLSVDNSANTTGVVVQLLDPGVIAGGVPLYGVANSGIIDAIQVVGGATDSKVVSLPSGPVVVREINQVAGAITPTTTLVRLET